MIAKKWFYEREPHINATAAFTFNDCFDAVNIFCAQSIKLPVGNRFTAHWRKLCPPSTLTIATCQCSRCTRHLQRISRATALSPVAIRARLSTLLLSISHGWQLLTGNSLNQLYSVLISMNHPVSSIIAGTDVCVCSWCHKGCLSIQCFVYNGTNARNNLKITNTATEHKKKVLDKVYRRHIHYGV